MREELGSQHQRHIQDLTDRNRLESDSNLAQLRIKYEDEIEHIKKLHQKELAQMIGETKRELEKHHKTEINSMLARHKHEIEMLRIREPVMGRGHLSLCDREVYDLKQIKNHFFIKTM